MADSGLIYARISQVFGETDDSLDNQVKNGETAAGTLGVPVHFVFRERDSGHETADTRKDLLKARQLVRDRKVTHFFIHNFDRLSRTPEELVTLWKECQKHSVKVVVCMWPQFHDLDLEMAKMMLRMIGMVGEFEWSFIRARTTQNKQRIRDRGQVVGEGGPRFGFTWNREERSRRPSEEPHPVFGISSATIVRTIFDLLGNHGYTLGKVAMELNQRGWPTPSVFSGRKFKDGRRPKWTGSSVRLIVIDQQYKGVVACCRSVMVGKRKSKRRPPEEWTYLTDARTEPLVEPALWERANQNVRENDVVGRRIRARRSAAETRNEKSFALFRGLIFCGQCEKLLRPVWAKSFGGEQVRMYRCYSYQEAQERGDEVCRGLSVYEWKVKDAVWQQVVKVATDEQLILAEARRLKEQRPGEAVHRASHEAALAEVEAAERRLKNLVSSLAEADDAEDRAMIREQIEQQKAFREGHRKQAERLAEQLAAYDDLDRKADEMIERCRQLKATAPELHELPDEEKRHWLDWLGVRLTGNGTSLLVQFDMGLVEAAEEADTPVIVDASDPVEHTRAPSGN